MNPFKERKKILVSLTRRVRPSKVPPKAVSCRQCGMKIPGETLSKHLYACPHCGAYEKMPAKERIRQIADEGTFRELSRSLQGGNPLDIPDYTEKIRDAQKKTGLREAVVTGTCKIGGVKSVLIVMDARFLMASMGTAVGERITRAFEYATRKKLPVVAFTASGGARMQEGMFSLLQMAKTSAAVSRHDEAGLLYIAFMTNPTTGGVTASFASLGDITLAEPKALIGFAGPRVIQQTIGENLPDGFQMAEFQREHGFVDAIVPRGEQKAFLARILQMHENGKRKIWK